MILLYHLRLSVPFSISVLIAPPMNSLILHSMHLCNLSPCRFDKSTKNYKLYFEDGKHYVGETRFDAVYDLVADGLIHFYVESRGAAVLATLASNAKYEFSPYYHTRYYTIQSRASLRRKAAAAAQKKGEILVEPRDLLTQVFAHPSFSSDDASMMSIIFRCS